MLRASWGYEKKYPQTIDCVAYKRQFGLYEKDQIPRENWKNNQNFSNFGYWAKYDMNATRSSLGAGYYNCFCKSMEFDIFKDFSLMS